MKAEIAEAIRNNTIPTDFGGRDCLIMSEVQLGHLVNDLYKLFKKENEPKLDKNTEDHIDWVIGYMNAAWDTDYRLSTEANRKFIRARLNDGHTPMEMQLVIDAIYKKWGDDPTMSQYLRPATVFLPSKFEGYLNQALRLKAREDNLIYVADSFGNKRRVTKEQFEAAESGFYRRLD
jgi:uncharacterized phage protein (TIGR02220 family)